MEKVDEKVNMQVFELLEKTNLTWTVSKEQLFSTDGKKTNSYGIFRSDNSQWLGTVGDRYEPMQNWEMAQTMVIAAQSLGLEASRGGYLKSGELTYLQMPLESVKIGKSAVDQLLSSLNSHDGSTSFGFGATRTVVVCQNTWQRAFVEMSKFRHTATLKERVEIARENMIIALQENDKQIADMKKMADTKVKSVEIVEQVMYKVLKMKEEQQKDLSTRRVNQIQQFLQAVDQSIKEQGDSIWAVFNGVTRYTNHVIGPKDESARNTYLMTGGGAELSNIAFDELMRIVNANTSVSVAV